MTEPNDPAPQMPLYTTEMTVEAAQITYCEQYGRDGFLNVEVRIPRMGNGGGAFFESLTYKVPTLFLSNGAPRPGDYLVKIDNVFSWLPKRMFVKDFTPHKDPNS